jgi:hypothetical protein
MLAAIGCRCRRDTCRTLVTADLNVPDDSGPCALHAAPIAVVSSPSNGQSMTVPSSASILSSGSPTSVADQVLANFTLLLSNAQNGYQSELSSVGLRLLAFIGGGPRSKDEQKADEETPCVRGRLGGTIDAKEHELVLSARSTSG